MSHLDTVPQDIDTGSAGLLSELLVEVFITRGAAYHGDVKEAADEFRDLFASFGILTEENEALIHGRAARVARRADRMKLRLVPNDPTSVFDA